MRKFLSFIFSMIIFILLVVLSINLSVKKLAIDTISDNMVKGEVSDFIIDIIYQEYPNIDSDKLGKIDNFIRESDEIDNITSKYIDGIISSIGSGNSFTPDIDDNLYNLIENNRDKLEECGISNDEIDKLSKEILDNNKIKDIYKVVNNSVGRSLTSEQKLVVGVYNVIVSNNLRYGLIVGIIICVIFLILLSKIKYNCFLKVGISSLIAGLFVKFGIVGIINVIAWEVTNNVLGRTSDINTGFLNKIGYTYIVVGIISIFLYLIWSNIEKKKLEP